jgi:hypothetical protein
MSWMGLIMELDGFDPMIQCIQLKTELELIKELDGFDPMIQCIQLVIAELRVTLGSATNLLLYFLSSVIVRAYVRACNIGAENVIHWGLRSSLCDGENRWLRHEDRRNILCTT